MITFLEFLPQATEEADEAYEYYESCEAGLGLRFRAYLVESCQELQQHPTHWRERPGGFRRVNLPVFPYYIAFFIRGQKIVIAAVAHAGRHPDYWKNRNLSS